MPSIASCAIPPGAANALQSAALAFLTKAAFSKLLTNIQGEGAASTPIKEQVNEETGGKEHSGADSSTDTPNVAAVVIVPVQIELPPVETTTTGPEPERASGEGKSFAVNVQQPALQDSSKKPDEAAADRTVDPELVHVIADSGALLGGLQMGDANISDRQGKAAVQENDLDRGAAELLSTKSEKKLADGDSFNSKTVAPTSDTATKSDSRLAAPIPEVKAVIPQKPDTAAKSQAIGGDSPESCNAGVQTAKTKSVVEFIDIRTRVPKPRAEAEVESKPQIGAVHPPASGQKLMAELGPTSDSSSRVAEVDSVLSPRAAMHVERMTERLTGSEFHFGFSSSDAGAMNVTARLREGTVNVGIAAERVETASALKAEVPVLEANLRERSLHLGEINIGSQSSMNAAMYSDGQRRGRPEWLPTLDAVSQPEEPTSSVVEETGSWIRSDRSSVSLLA